VPFSLLAAALRMTCLVCLAAWAGCSPAPSDDQAASRRVLHYFTWSDYVGPEIIREFEQREQARVVIDTFSSNEELLAKLQSGATGYDVAVPSDFMVGIMIQQGLLSELDPHQLPHASLLEPHLQALHFDPERRYSIPYLWGTVGIGYDSAVIATAPDSWSILWDPHFKGRISMLNDQREVFGAVLRSMGQSMNSTDKQVIEAAKAQLLRQKPLVKIYTSDHYDQLLASGEVVLAHGWGGPIARAMAERPSIRYVVPKEGATLWADCLVVLRTAPQRDLAMRFIDFLMEPEIAARTSERLKFASASRGAREHVSEATRNNPAIYPPADQLERLEWMRDVGPAIRLYDRAWTELKMQ
jgi:spermidine/putrescine-binding protein